MLSEVASHVINVVLIVLVLAALCTDVRHRRIPNWQTLPAMGLGIALNFLYAGHTGLLTSLGGGLIGVGLLVIPYLLGGMGAGDVKLLMAIGTLKGWPFIFWTASYAALVGGALGILVVVKRRSVLRLLRYLLGLPMTLVIGACLPPVLRVRLSYSGAERPESLSVRLPYGLAIGLGTLAALYLQQLH